MPRALWDGVERWVKRRDCVFASRNVTKYCGGAPTLPTWRDTQRSYVEYQCRDASTVVACREDGSRDRRHQGMGSVYNQLEYENAQQSVHSQAGSAGCVLPGRLEVKLAWSSITLNTFLSVCDLICADAWVAKRRIPPADLCSSTCNCKPRLAAARALNWSRLCTAVYHEKVNRRSVCFQPS